jgi:hypothetical protein
MTPRSVPGDYIFEFLDIAKRAVTRRHPGSAVASGQRRSSIEA